MNTLVRCRGWHLSIVVLGCLLLLAGCGPEGRAGLDAELYAGDDTVQTLKRYFFPATYWKEKSLLLQERVKQQQEAFNERTRAYHGLLEKRRERVNQVVSQAEAAGKSGDEARRAVIQEYRATLDPVREEARQLGKELRRAMALLAQAEIAARQNY
ncbi:MAG: hypothetical protein H7836_10920 [Magnetococcus sp. YQC-3]